MRSDLLHVIGVIANPMRFKRRVELFKRFMHHMLESRVRLAVVECGFGDREWEIPVHPDVMHVRVRANTVNWAKENLINIGISRLPHDWEYVAWVDGDIHFRHAEWASETVHALQQYCIIQPWADCLDLGPHGELIEHHKSFADRWWHRRIHGIGKGYEFAHPGYAWATRREVLEKLGGLIEHGVGGAGDHHMALAMINRVSWSIPGGLTAGYQRPLYQWQERCNQHLSQKIGRLHGIIEHFWHGSKKKRQYIERWEILARNRFDPLTDLKRNVYGVLELAGNKPQLAHDLDVYFRQRNEDSNEMD